METLELRGWLHEEERLALKRWCFGKDVLEMGSFQGLSSCCIAMTARTLICVDTFDGRGTAEPGEYQEVFWKNINAIQRSAQVKAIKGLFSEVLPNLRETFDIIFIDGSHDYESVVQDIELAIPKLRPGGVLLMHDYSVENPGVVKAIDEFVAEGARPVAQINSLVMFRVDEHHDPEPVKPRVLIGVPHRDGWALYGCVTRAAVRASKKYTHWVADRGNSVLTLTFNELLAEALNKRDEEGCTHFAMLHNDIVPCEGWVDILMEEMYAHDLDFISAVVPIKNPYGLTSTATDHLGYPWGVRRLTMKEVFDLPETFVASDVKHRDPDAPLLLNSGCTLMKINEPWVSGLCYRQTDRIARTDTDNTWIAQSISEDWDMSRQLFARGCRLGATRKVSLYHQIPMYNNHSVWGSWEVDEDYMKAQREIAEIRAKDGNHKLRTADPVGCDGPRPGPVRRRRRVSKEPKAGPKGRARRLSRDSGSP